LPADILSLKVTGQFSPAEFLAGHDEQTQIIKQETTFASSLPLISTNSLNVHIAGPVPIAAWIPFPGSRLRIGGSTSPYPQEQLPLEMVEHYGNDLGFQAQTPMEALQRYPLLDVLGPTVIFWTRTSNGSVPGVLEDSGSGNVVAVIVRGGIFSVRMAAEPMNRHELAELRHYARDQVMVSPLTATENGPHTVTGMSGEYGASDNGSIHLKVANSLDQESYEQVTALVKQTPRVHTDLVLHADHFFVMSTSNPKEELRQVELEGYNEEDRYPPLPARVGVNVFGPLSLLHFARASGNLLINGQGVDVPAASELSLDDVQHLVDRNGRQLITLPVSVAASEGDTIDFTGEAEVTLNGDSKTGFLVRYRTILSVLLTIFALLTGTLAVLEFFDLGARRPRRTKANRT
jgi:hypothetical protein